MHTLPLKDNMRQKINRETIIRGITISGITLVTLIIVGYSYVTSYGLIQGPEISLNGPASSTSGYAYSTSTSPSATISGIAKRVNSLTLNGKPIVIDQQGNFSQNILLFKGYNTERIEGLDKFGHTANIKIDLVYTES